MASLHVRYIFERRLHELRPVGPCSAADELIDIAMKAHPKLSEAQQIVLFNEVAKKLLAMRDAGCGGAAAMASFRVADELRAQYGVRSSLRKKKAKKSSKKPKKRVSKKKKSS